MKILLIGIDTLLISHKNAGAVFNACKISNNTFGIICCKTSAVNSSYYDTYHAIFTINNDNITQMVANTHTLNNKYIVSTQTAHYIFSTKSNKIVLIANLAASSGSNMSAYVIICSSINDPGNNNWTNVGLYRYLGTCLNESFIMGAHDSSGSSGLACACYTIDGTTINSVGSISAAKKHWTYGAIKSIELDSGYVMIIYIQREQTSVSSGHGADLYFLAYMIAQVTISSFSKISSENFTSVEGKSFIYSYDYPPTIYFDKDINKIYVLVNGFADSAQSWIYAPSVDTYTIRKTKNQQYVLNLDSSFYLVTSDIWSDYDSYNATSYLGSIFKSNSYIYYIHQDENQQIKLAITSIEIQKTNFSTANGIALESGTAGDTIQVKIPNIS